jgi:hypothetical protein
MRSILIIAVTLLGLSSGLHAEDNAGSGYGLPTSERGPAFPAGVSPTEPNPANWIARRQYYTDPFGPNNRRWGWHYRGR